MTILFANNASAPIASSITTSSTTITVSSGQGSEFPAITGTDYFVATLVDTSNNLEIVKVTARSGDVMTVVRAQESTVARSYAAGSLFELRTTAATLTSFAQIAGDQTFTGIKTFSSTIVGNISGSAATATTANALNTSNSYTAVNMTLTGYLSTIQGLTFGGSGVVSGFYGDSTNVAIRSYGTTGNIYFQNASGVGTYLIMSPTAITAGVGVAFAGLGTGLTGRAASFEAGNASKLASGGAGGAGMTFTYNGVAGQPGYLWGTAGSGIGQNELYSPGNITVGGATWATYMNSNGGLQNMTYGQVGSMGIFRANGSSTGGPYALNQLVAVYSGTYRILNEVQMYTYGCCAGAYLYLCVRAY